MDPKTIYQSVQKQYGSIARAENPEYSGAIAEAFGYSKEELDSIPKDANLGLSCGNPLAIASLRQGETVIDLGSGAGFDVFLAAKKVGASGRAIGVDMNKDMLARAHENLAKSKANNVTFIEAQITSIPLVDGIADCVISNCVINLVPEADKPAVFAEMARILKPNGRVAISDILARKTLPLSMREDVTLYTGCIAGAGTTEDYKRFLEDTGFSDIMVVDTESDLNIYVNTTNLSQRRNENAASCCGQSKKSVNSVKGGEATGEGMASGCLEVGSKGQSCSGATGGGETQLGEGEPVACSKANIGHKDPKIAGIDLNEWVGSFKIFAVKL